MAYSSWIVGDNVGNWYLQTMARSNFIPVPGKGKVSSDGERGGKRDWNRTRKA